MKETLLKSAMYQIIIPLDTSIEKVIDTENFTIKEFKDNDNLFLIERIKIDSKKDFSDPLALTLKKRKEKLVEFGVKKKISIIDKVL
jgi:hypothetical protein